MNRKDCSKISERIHEENREEHNELFRALIEIRKEISDTRIMILEKLRGNE